MIQGSIYKENVIMKICVPNSQIYEIITFLKRKNKVGRINLSDLKAYYTATVIKTVIAEEG